MSFAQGLEATETAGPFSLLIENVTMVLSFAQIPQVANISKHSHEQKYIEFPHKVSRRARVIGLFNCGKTAYMESSAAPLPGAKEMPGPWDS